MSHGDQGPREIVSIPEDNTGTARLRTNKRLALVILVNVNLARTGQHMTEGVDPIPMDSPVLFL
jgi:hypothetical protein